MTTEAEERQDVTVFWDIETTFASNSATIPISTSQVVANLRAELARFGPLRSIRAYWDYAGYPVVSSTTRIRSELSAAGVMLIDCPGEGRKAAAMKKMLVDVVLHAWDHPSPHTFVVITSDQDAAYCISTLRMRYYRVILLTSAGSHLDLTSQASVNLDWSRGILGLSGATLAPKEPELPLYESQQSTTNLPPPSNLNTPVPPVQHRRITLNDYDSGAELAETPARGRRQPLFSKSLDANYGAFGDLGSSYMTPSKTMAFTGFGDGPLFPRSQSISNLKAARSGSAPPHDLPPPNPLGPFRRGSDFAFSTPPPTAGLKGKAKEREFPVFEPDDIPPPRPSTKARPSWISSTFEPFDEDDKVDKQPIKEVNAARKASVISVSSVDSLETHYSLVEPLDQQTTAPTSAEQEDPHKFVNSDKTRQYTAPGPFAEEPTSVESTHDGPASPASSRHPLHSRRASITSQRLDERPASVAPPQPASTPPPATQSKASSSTSTGSSPRSSPAPAAAPRPIAPLPTRILTSTPGASSSNTQAGPSNARAPTTSRLGITELPKIWGPLIITLRNHKGVLPYQQLPIKMLKSYPSAYSLAGKSKYGKYIDAAITAGIVSKISTTDGPAIRVGDAYA